MHLNHSFPSLILTLDTERYIIGALKLPSSFSPQDHLVILGFKKQPLEFIVPIVEGYALTQEYSIFAHFHPMSNFQNFNVVPLTLTV